MPIIAETNAKLQMVQFKLELPTNGRKSEVAVVGSSGLAFHGIRPARDTDLLVTQNLFYDLAQYYPIDSSEFPRITIPLPFRGRTEEIDIFTTNGPYSGKGNYPSIKDLFESTPRCARGCLLPVRLDVLGELKEVMGPAFDREKDEVDVFSIKEHLQLCA